MENEWGWEKRGDNQLFEMLTLEGAQAGLSWSTILKKRPAYRSVFHNFDVERCAKMTADDLDALLGSDSAIVKNRRKVESVPHNARCILALKEKPYLSALGPCRTLDELLWSFVDGRPRLNHWKDAKSIPSSSPESEAMSKALKKLGFRFVGPITLYSLMQSCGLVIDHPVGTPEYEAALMRVDT